MTKIEGQAALVTGASRGIGRAIAGALAERGCSLVLTARSAERLEEVEDECRRLGATATASYPADLSEPHEVDRLAQDVKDAGWIIDVLVNNAGRGTTGNAAEGDPGDWDRMLALNLHAPMRLTRQFAPAMVERERGTIINIGSVAAIEGMTTSGAYAASKHGLRGWSLSCYRNLRGYGIKVSLINPGFVATDLTHRAKGARQDRMIRAEDVASAAMLAVTTSPMCCPEEITLRLTRYAYD